MKNNFVKALSTLVDQAQLFLIDQMKEEPKPRISVFPFISGDLFLALADVIILKTQYEPVILRKRKEVLFVEAELIEDRSKLDYAAQFKVVIVHNGDHQIKKSSIDILLSYGCVLFATNVKNQTPNVFTIPIGIENAHHRRNGGIHYFNPINMAEVSMKKEKDVLISFNTSTNPTVRERIEKICLHAGHSNEKMSIFEYRKQIAKTRFVISPPGNGIDCHRTWEAFYHKAIPVIEKKYWMFDRHELPVLIVDDIKEFIGLSSLEMIKYYNLVINEKSYNAIYFDYWLNFINEKSQIRK